MTSQDVTSVPAAVTVTITGDTKVEDEQATSKVPETTPEKEPAKEVGIPAKHGADANVGGVGKPGVESEVKGGSKEDMGGESELIEEAFKFLDDSVLGALEDSIYEEDTSKPDEVTLVENVDMDLTSQEDKVPCEMDETQGKDTSVSEGSIVPVVEDVSDNVKSVDEDVNNGKEDTPAYTVPLCPPTDFVEPDVKPPVPEQGEEPSTINIESATISSEQVDVTATETLPIVESDAAHSEDTLEETDLDAPQDISEVSNVPDEFADIEVPEGFGEPLEPKENQSMPDIVDDKSSITSTDVPENDSTSDAVRVDPALPAPLPVPSIQLEDTCDEEVSEEESLHSEVLSPPEAFSDVNMSSEMVEVCVVLY